MNSADLDRLSAAASLLWQAHETIGDSDDALINATAELVRSAAETASAVCGGGIETAREAVSSARAAVITATYVTRALGNRHSSTAAAESESPAPASAPTTDEHIRAAVPQQLPGSQHQAEGRTAGTTVEPIRIAVIGVGPRGLSVIERVISHTRLDGPPVELLLIEPGELGIGVHQVKQPDFLLLNTIASQLTIFSDEEMAPGAPVTPGPSLFEWCQAQNKSVRFDEFLPRRHLGEYLQWAVGQLLAGAPSWLTVRHLPTHAVGLRQDGDGAVMTLADGTDHRVDLAVVTTGHGLPGAAPANTDRLIVTPYPLPAQLEHIPAGATVALIGTGLTAMDVIASLTVGRGGSFVGDSYVASGQEPRIVLASRSGRLPCARPATTLDRRPAPAKYFTPAAIARLRSSTADGRLDFKRDIEPLISREALSRMPSATAAEIAFVQDVLNPTAQSWADYAQYLTAMLGTARQDLHEAQRGLGVSLVKEALEVLRDHRAGLRAAIDAPGLTEDSHRYFMTEYSSLVNRAVIGPQKERIQELLILIQAGVVLPSPGPRPELVPNGSGWTLRSTQLGHPHSVEVDIAIRTNLSWPTTDADLDPIGHSLRSWVAAGPGGQPCLKLDRDGYVIPRLGDGPARGIAVFGPPAEGASYYNHYVPSPGVWSRALTDLDRVLVPLLSTPALAPRRR
jgi:hypothetical protein